MNRLATIAVATIALLTTANVRAAQLFSDAFNSVGSSSNYSEVSVNQTQLTYIFDYNTMGIPPAPHTIDSSTLGLKLEANMSAGLSAAVTLHTVQQFSGAYNVRFDAWINANGPFGAGGSPLGTGSTQYLTAGVGGNGSTVNGSSTSTTAQTGIGGWTAVDGEGGTTPDYRLHKNGTVQAVSTGQYAAGTASNAQDNANSYYAPFTGINVGNLPVQGANVPGGITQQSGTTATGTVGFAWRTVEMRVNPTNGTGGAATMAWYIDGLRIGTLDAGNASGSFAASGSVTIGYWDPFTSISDNTDLSFGLIDNLVVYNADFNSNSIVDAADYVLWRKNSGLTSGATNAQGDANGDGKVDSTDYTLWRQTFGLSTTGSGSALDTGSVPEPAACLLALMGLVLAVLGRRWRRI